MRQLIVCPKCHLDGSTKILGEILPDGLIAIARQRSKYSFEEMTLVKAKEVSLICGYCRTPAYIRKEDYENTHLGTIGVYWNSTLIGSLVTETRSSQNTQGVALLVT